MGFFPCECELFFGAVCERASVRDESGEMVGSVESATVVVEDGFSKSKKWTLLSQPAEALPEEIPVESFKTILPGLVNGQSEEAEKDVVVEQTKNFVLGKNIHGTCLEITEPEMDDDVTGDRDAYMAGILARYRKTLVEKTKFHLGTHATVASILFYQFI